MSDDDLWRHDDSGDRSGQDDGGSAEDAPPGVGDETQPITGTPPAPPPGPSPPTPPYDPPSGPGTVPPPQNPYSNPDPDQSRPSPYGGQPSPPPPNPYPAPNEYAAPQNPYGAPYHPAYAGGGLPDHPSATTAMVLGIIGLVSIVLCGGILLILSPFAWAMGAKAVREIDASPGRYAGRDKAQGGKIMGIIGSVILALGVLAIIAFVVLVVAVGSSNDPQPVFPSTNFQNG